jgi:hypothetical protein
VADPLTDLRLLPETGNGHYLGADALDPVTVEVFSVAEKVGMQLPGLDTDAGNDVAGPRVISSNRIT